MNNSLTNTFSFEQVDYTLKEIDCMDELIQGWVDSDELVDFDRMAIWMPFGSTYCLEESIYYAVSSIRSSNERNDKINENSFCYSYQMINSNRFDSELQTVCRAQQISMIDNSNERFLQNKMSEMFIENNENKQKKSIVFQKRGRPRGGRVEKKVSPPLKKPPQLWKLLIDLLKSDKTNPKLMSWVSQEDGMFKFNKSEEVAKLWGQRKNNTSMTYAKMSRSLRHYYKTNILVPSYRYGRQMVYRFAPNFMKIIGI